MFLKQQNGPVFYGPDGQIMTPEERQFLQESVGRIPDHEEYDDYRWVVLRILLELHHSEFAVHLVCKFEHYVWNVLMCLPDVLLATSCSLINLGVYCRYEVCSITSLEEVCHLMYKKIAIDDVCIALSILKILINEMQSSQFPFWISARSWDGVGDVWKSPFVALWKQNLLWMNMVQIQSASTPLPNWSLPPQILTKS